MPLNPYHARLRSRDEEILNWLSLRCSGLLCRDIAAITGSTQEIVRVATCEVLADDLEYSQERTGVVRAAYWGLR